jgi:hypothetical protein
VDGAGAGVALLVAAHDPGQTDQRMFHLSLPGFTSKLSDNLHHLGHA